MIKSAELENSAYEFEAKMPLRHAVPLGLQHVFAMFVGNLTPLLIITSACGLAGGEFADLQVSLLQNAMFVAGIVTLVQLYGLGPVGGKVPIIMGTSSGFLGVFKMCIRDRALPRRVPVHRLLPPLREGLRRPRRPCGRQALPDPLRQLLRHVR